MKEFEPTSQEKECTGHAAEGIKTAPNQPTDQGKNVESAQWEDKWGWENKSCAQVKLAEISSTH